MPSPGDKAAAINLKKRFWASVREAQLASFKAARRKARVVPAKKKVVKKKAAPKKVAKKAIKPRARPKPAAKKQVARTLPAVSAGPQRHGVKARRTVQGQLPANRLIFEKA